MNVFSPLARDVYISCLQPTSVSPALNNGRRASSVIIICESAKDFDEEKKKKKNAACQFTFLLDKPGCMDARMNEHEPCDVNLECPLEPFDISKCLKRHKGVLKNGSQSRGSLSPKTLKIYSSLRYPGRRFS